MKYALRVIAGLLYFIALGLSLVITVKPGASFFYDRTPLQPEQLITTAGLFEASFEINKTFYNLDSLLVLEDERVITPDAVEISPNREQNPNVFSWFGSARVAIVFSPGTAPDQALNEHSYQAAVRPFFITRQWGLVSSIFLVACLLGYLVLAWRDPSKKSGQFLGSPSYAVSAWKQRSRLAMGSTRDYLSLHQLYLVRVTARTLLFAVFYVFMEWVFFLTKPSFMDILSVGEKIQTFWLTGFAVGVLALLVLALILALDVLITPIFHGFRTYALHFPFAFLTACLGLILLDNFTYTVFKFGIATTTSPIRIIYALAFLALTIAVMRTLGTASRKAGSKNSWYLVTAAGYLLVSVIFIGLTFEPERTAGVTAASNAGSNNRPNIVFISSDGLNAANMSVYGYERDTTPFLRELARTSLISQNSFANAGASLGTETAVLTGKSPFTTRVLFSPDILRGVDVYQHLPGLLKNNGYRTVSLGVQFYVDPNTINFQNAFDAVNCRENAPDDLLHRLSGIGFNNEAYFLSTLHGRLTGRLKHIFFIEDMENPYDLVTKIDPNWMGDNERMDCLHAYLDDSLSTGQPLFAHIHLMGTHGDQFNPPEQFFSNGKVQDQPWMTDFYDDAILAFDNTVKELVQHLQDNGQYGNTLLVIYTDHAQAYNNTKRTPLIVHFPHDQHSGTIEANTQSIDLAPTVLDYLGLDQPEWMEGSSLLGELDPSRLVMIGRMVATVTDSRGWSVVPEDMVLPPFYQFGRIFAIQCQKFVEIDLRDLTMRTGEIEGYVNPCPADSLDSEDVIRAKVGEFFTERGFELPAEW